MGGGGETGRGGQRYRPGEIKAVSPVVREVQNSADSSTSCILVRHLPHLEHDSSPGEVQAFHFFLVCNLEYFIVHLTFARGEARGSEGEDNRGRLYLLWRKRMRVTPQNLHRREVFA